MQETCPERNGMGGSDAEPTPDQDSDEVSALEQDFD